MMFSTPTSKVLFPDVEIPAEGTAAEPVMSLEAVVVCIAPFCSAEWNVEDYKLAEHFKAFGLNWKQYVFDLLLTQLSQEKVTWLSTSRDYAYNHPLMMTPQNRKIYSDLNSSTARGDWTTMTECWNSEQLVATTAERQPNEKIYCFLVTPPAKESGVLDSLEQKNTSEIDVKASQSLITDCYDT